MKRIIILGATSGIGKELAQLYAKGDNKVAITGRRAHLLEELKNENPNFITRTFDITQPNDIKKNLDELANELGGIDLLIISSGTGNINPNLDFDIEKQTVETNVVGFTCVCDWAINYFEKQGSGQLVGITSVAGLRGSRYAPSYNASKAYQINYLEAMRQKVTYLKIPICITDIRPGFVDTDMAKGEGLFWVASVAKAGKQIYKAIEKKKKIAYITKRWRFVSAIFKLIPNWIYNKM
jgi:Short-chain dehydrogenases of various substrate specificities